MSKKNKDGVITADAAATSAMPEHTITLNAEQAQNLVNLTQMGAQFQAELAAKAAKELCEIIAAPFQAEAAAKEAAAAASSKA